MAGPNSSPGPRPAVKQSLLPPQNWKCVLATTNLESVEQRTMEGVPITIPQICKFCSGFVLDKPGRESHIEDLEP